MDISTITLALEDYKECEEALLDYLQMVPYCAEHHDVWSTHLADILIKSASQLDSLFYSATSPARLNLAGIANPLARMTIVDHFNTFSGQYNLPDRRILLWAFEPTWITPFDGWTATHSPSWWTAYNNVKHNRLANIKEATMLNTTNAVAGLLIVMSSLYEFIGALAGENWFHGGGQTDTFVESQLASLDPVVNATPVHAKPITLETKLFTYPYTQLSTDPPERWYRQMVGSLRFQHYCTRLLHP